MKMRLIALGVVICVALVASGRPHARVSAANVNSVSMLSVKTISPGMMSTNMGEDDFRRLEQAWLDAAAVPDLPALRKMLSDDFMGTSFGAGVLGKNDVVPRNGSTENHMPKCVLKDSTVKIFGDTAVLMGEVEMQVRQKSEAMRMTTVFQKHGEDWQVIAVHMSKAAEGPS